MFKYVLLFLAVGSLSFAQETVEESQDLAKSFETLLDFDEDDLEALRDAEEELLFGDQVISDTDEEVDALFQ